ncbi:hypothetical protein [Calothrix sp. UHCC 0171]|uniref:hypothetical protein n=1 Tax=Calothrix sp. UHCC 0171 TaxID=3110245 RepID=UPI002B201A8D|nr:hypothetical protein [Calothrix sp. UHCC 0171]MEA5571451.1 hypothetical protein [Calothrix sp. UHCC 0171]
MVIFTIGFDSHILDNTYLQITGIMVEETSDRQHRIEKFLNAVEAAQKLQDDIMTHGLDAAYLYYQDIDSSWLENWDENEDKSILESILMFLESDDEVAERFREQLISSNTENTNQLGKLPEIAIELEKSLTASSQETERLFATKDVLISHLSSKLNLIENNTMSLFDLAKELIEKLEHIVIQNNAEQS